MLEKTPESPLDCKEIEPVNPKGNQSWIFIGRTDAEAEAPILWLPDVNNWLIGKDPDAGKDWGREEKGMTENEMVGWHHQLNGHESEKLRETVKDKEALRAAVHGFTKSWTRLSNNSKVFLSPRVNISCFVHSFPRSPVPILHYCRDFSWKAEHPELDIRLQWWNCCSSTNFYYFHKELCVDENLFLLTLGLDFLGKIFQLVGHPSLPLWSSLLTSWAWGWISFQWNHLPRFPCCEFSRCLGLKGPDPTCMPISCLFWDGSILTAPEWLKNMSQRTQPSTQCCSEQAPQS